MWFAGGEQEEIMFWQIRNLFRGAHSFGQVHWFCNVCCLCSYGPEVQW